MLPVIQNFFHEIVSSNLLCHNCHCIFLLCCQVGSGQHGSIKESLQMAMKLKYLMI